VQATAAGLSCFAVQGDELGGSGGLEHSRTHADNIIRSTPLQIQTCKIDTEPNMFGGQG
jgi:hypothetical protein